MGELRRKLNEIWEAATSHASEKEDDPIVGDIKIDTTAYADSQILAEARRWLTIKTKGELATE